MAQEEEGPTEDPKEGKKERRPSQATEAEEVDEETLLIQREEGDFSLKEKVNRPWLHVLSQKTKVFTFDARCFL